MANVDDETCGWVNETSNGLQKSGRLVDINYFVIFRDDSMKFDDVERKRQIENSQDNNCRMLVSPEFTKER